MHRWAGKLAQVARESHCAVAEQAAHLNQNLHITTSIRVGRGAVNRSAGLVSHLGLHFGDLPIHELALDVPHVHHPVVLVAECVDGFEDGLWVTRRRVLAHERQALLPAVQTWHGLLSFIWRRSFVRGHSKARRT